MTSKYSQWNSSDYIGMVKKYVGNRYSNLSQLEEAKKAEATYIIDYLGLDSNSNVLDLGSGMGLIALHVAPQVRHLYCADVSKTFIRECVKQLASMNNVSFELIKYGDLSRFSNLDAIYCTAVFIHFNIYDIYIYLSEMYKSLSNSGAVLFDFYDVDYFEVSNETFQRHAKKYKQDQHLVTNINYNSKTAILNICNTLGFAVEFKRQGLHPIILARKQQ